MTPDLETGTASIMPEVSAMDDDILRQTISFNMERARYLGHDLAGLAPSAPGEYAKGHWRSRIVTGTSGNQRLYIRGEKIDLDEVFLVFVGPHLLHISKPIKKEICRINFTDAIAPDNRITVVGRSGILMCESGGDFWTHDAVIDNTHRITDLATAIMNGKFVTKKGGVLAPKYQLHSTKIKLVNLYSAANACLEQKFGYRLHASHGTLLGLVREGDLIEHDDDFDCAYVSRHETCAEVSQERFGIIDHLISCGFRCRLGVSGHIKIKQNGVEIDLMPAWFDGESYNVSGFTSIPLDKGAMYPLDHHQFHGAAVCIPARPEEFLRLNYGPGWRVPDPFYRSVPPAKAKIHRSRFKADQLARPDLL
ncbi:MAG TPA: hypothetical protein GX700_16120 [Paracoccus sp.]|nr:hypothetical protein [Paracoccus sp. (in: a-proteobacteria)]